jgi:hypothetical protein
LELLRNYTCIALASLMYLNAWSHLLLASRAGADFLLLPLPPDV